MLSVVACSSNDINGKIGRLEKAIETEPNNPKLYYQLATLYYEKSGSQNVQKAIELYSKSVTLDDNYAQAHADLGIAYERKGLQKKAQAEFQEAMRLEMLEQQRKKWTSYELRIREIFIFKCGIVKLKMKKVSESQRT